MYNILNSFILYIDIYYLEIHQRLVKPALPSFEANFSSAVGLMGMEAAVVEDAWSKTPAAKRPRLEDEVKEALEDTPPPVLGPQSDPWLSTLTVLFWF